MLLGRLAEYFENNNKCKGLGHPFPPCLSLKEKLCRKVTFPI